MSMNLSLSKFESGHLVMLSFWDKKRKNAFFKKCFSLTNFQQVHCVHVNNYVHHIAKHSKG